MTDIERYIWGAFGSIAMELINILAIFQSGRKFPSRYRRIGFWVVRLLVAAVGGGLAYAYSIDNKILAIHVGAATPFIMQQLSRTLPAQDQE
jgi:hypothetical protein